MAQGITLPVRGLGRYWEQQMRGALREVLAVVPRERAQALLRAAQEGRVIAGGFTTKDHVARCPMQWLGCGVTAGESALTRRARLVQLATMQFWSAWDSLVAVRSVREDDAGNRYPAAEHPAVAILIEEVEAWLLRSAPGQNTTSRGGRARTASGAAPRMRVSAASPKGVTASSTTAAALST